MRDALRAAALDRRDVNVAVVRGQVYQTALGVKDVIIVDRRQVIDGHPFQLDLGSQVEPPEQPVPVEQQSATVRSPVRCLQKQRVGGIHQFSRAVTDLGDPHLRPLAGLEPSRHHFQVIGVLGHGSSGFHGLAWCIASAGWSRRAFNDAVANWAGERVGLHFIPHD
jgi:hypothetical protein